jgi:hypothetical protein
MQQQGVEFFTLLQHQRSFSKTKSRHPANIANRHAEKLRCPNFVRRRRQHRFSFC